MSRGLVLVSLDWIRPKDPRVSLGHASLLARLQRVPGLAVTPVVFAVNDPSFSDAALLDAVIAAARGGADVAIGAYVWNEPAVQRLLPALRGAGFAGRIILGGPQISYSSAGLDRVYPQADVFIRGYGEDALAAVAVGDAAGIPGVTLPGSDHGRTTAAVDLRALPSPFLSGVLPAGGFVRWETQRGCVFSCSFCQHREPGARLRQTTLAPGRIMDEIGAFVAAGVREIAVLDPIFQSNPDAAEILRRFRHLGFRGRLSLQSRFELISADFLDACDGLDVQLEFGLQSIHPAELRAVRRRNDMGKVGEVIAELHRRGMPFEVSLIYGLPEQTLASFRQSVAWCQERGVPTIKAFPLMLLRGTGLDQERGRWGLVESDDPIPVVTASSSISHLDWCEMRALAERLHSAGPVAGSS